MVFAKSMKHKKLKRQWFLQNHENIKNCTYLLPAAMPGNNSEPKTWANIRLKSSNSRLWYQHAKNTGICFVRKSSCIHLNWKHLLAKSRILLGKSKHKKAAKFAAVISTTHVESLVPIRQSKYAATISSEKRINFGDTDFHFPCSSADTFCHKHSLKCQEYQSQTRPRRDPDTTQTQPRFNPDTAQTRPRHKQPRHNPDSTQTQPRHNQDKTKTPQ